MEVLFIPAIHAKKRNLVIKVSFLEAPTRFELVIEVLQTFALPLGYGAISNCNHKNISCGLSDSYGNRTRVTAVKGRCLNRLTTEPDIDFFKIKICK